jgi:CheY-like chemotaxis protein
MPHELLLVEDNSHKRDRIVNFLHESFPHWVVVEAHSFTAASRHVLGKHFSVILMDMSLPTYSKSESDSGGRFRTFGGREIARKALRRGIHTRILFLTQYEAFSDQGTSKTLQTLDEEMKTEYGDMYAGLIHYDSSKSIWKEMVSKTLDEVERENSDR